MCLFPTCIRRGCSVRRVVAAQAISVPSKMEESQSRFEERMFSNAGLSNKGVSFVEDVFDEVLDAISFLNSLEADSEIFLKGIHPSPKRTYLSEGDKHGKAALFKSEAYDAHQHKKAKTAAEAIDVPDSNELTTFSHTALSDDQNWPSALHASKLVHLN